MKKRTFLNPSRLIQYSAAALGVIATHEANAQVVYTDIDPDLDLHFFAGDTYQLDLDNDGIDDFEIQALMASTIVTGSSSSSTSVSYTYKLKVTPLLDNEVFHDTGEDMFEVGVWVDDGLAGGAFQNTPASFAFNFPDIPEFIGLHLNTGGADQYGWLRLYRSGTTSLLLDYAYETSDAAAIYTQVPGGPHGVSNITLADISDTHTAADVQVSFTVPEDESGVYSYRIFAGGYFFSLYSAIAADPSQYVEVFPTGADQTITLSPTQLDVLDDPIEEFDMIVVSVVSMSFTNPNESVRAVQINAIVPGHDVMPPSDVTVDIGPGASIAGKIDVEFTTADDIHGIINYLTYVVPADQLPITDTVALVTNVNRMVLNDWEVPGGEFNPNTTYHANVWSNDINADLLEYNKAYAVCVHSHTLWDEYTDYAFETINCSDTFVVSETVSVEDLSVLPFNGFVNETGIHVMAQESFDEVSLYAIDGKLIYNQTMNTNETSIPLPASSGNYIIKIRKGNQFGTKQVSVTR